MPCCVCRGSMVGVRCTCHIIGRASSPASRSLGRGHADTALPVETQAFLRFTGYYELCSDR